MKDIKRISTDIESWFATFFGWQKHAKLFSFPQARESSLGCRHGSRSLRQLLHPSMGPGWGSYGGFLKGETTNMKLYTIDLAWSNGWYLKNLTSHIANPFLGTLYSEHNLVKPVPRKTLSFRLISMFIVGSETDEVQRNTPIMMVQDGLRIFQRRISPEITSKTCYGQPVGFPSYSEKRMFESTTPSTPCEFKVPKRSMQAKSR